MVLAFPMLFLCENNIGNVVGRYALSLDSFSFGAIVLVQSIKGW